MIAPDGVQIGVLETKKALVLSNELGLDLVEVSPEASPPVARLMNYGKFKYEQSQKIRESKKRQTKINDNEVDKLEEKSKLIYDSIEKNKLKIGYSQILQKSLINQIF